MIKEEYKNGCRLKEQVKYNIDYDDCQILNLTCANYIYDLVQESSKYETKLEDVKKMLYMIEKLLGHEVQNVLVGFQYFDTTINKPIFWDGSKWIDATGATV